MTKKSEKKQNNLDDSLKNKEEKECVVLELKCRGTDLNGNHVLPIESSEPIVLRVKKEMGYRNQVFCRYLGRIKEGKVIDETCTICQNKRDVPFYIKDRPPLPDCHYISYGFSRIC